MGMSIEGVLETHRSELDRDPSRQCTCCSHEDGMGHVFAYGVKVPWKAWTGREGTLADWIHEQLRPYKLQPGVKVRVTVEVVKGEGPGAL